MIAFKWPGHPPKNPGNATAKVRKLGLSNMKAAKETIHLTVFFLRKSTENIMHFDNECQLPIKGIFKIKRGKFDYLPLSTILIRGLYDSFSYLLNSMQVPSIHCLIASSTNDFLSSSKIFS